MSLKDKEKWNLKYTGADCLAGRAPCDWLVQNRDLLTGKGKALDLAMGEGRNALYLAELGYEVVGVDISDVGVARAQALARENNLRIETVVADLDTYQIPENEYDLIACFYFLNRNLFPAIRKGLRPGGLLFFETFSLDYLQFSSFRREWVLDYNELLREFGDWHVLRYREETDPVEEKATAGIVAKKWKEPNV